MATTRPLKTFIIYASADRKLRKELEDHLIPLVDAELLHLWSDKQIMPGEEWNKVIETQLVETELFVMLVSSSFFKSEYIRHKEFKEAVDKMRAGTAIVLPVIIKPCGWKHFPIIKDLQVLPHGGGAITDTEHWNSRDKGWEKVLDGIAARVEHFWKEKTAAAERERAEIARIAAEAAAGLAREKEATKQAEPARIVAESAAALAREKAAAAEALRFAAEAVRRTADPFHELMVRVEGGTFQMGGNEYDDEKPIHAVAVPTFFIGKYPVTQAQWRKVMGSHPPKLSIPGCDDCPVEGVSWRDVQEFLTKLNAQTGQQYRLPSEAEWEYAARGGRFSKGYKFAGSDNLDEVGWYSENAGGKTHPVGGLKANELGLYDMSGNVWEWCADDWHGNYNGAPTDGSVWVGKRRGILRVFRGGGWVGSAASCRVAGRYYYATTIRGNLGFRLARSF